MGMAVDMLGQEEQGSSESSKYSLVADLIKGLHAKGRGEVVWSARVARGLRELGVGRRGARPRVRKIGTH